ncbi:DUF6881 domain-containing protein [Streptomyces sp. Ru72]|uniref:DUF6881 domain-containing protein n=1 Tax=Streptomyces sp. Ru72 TaxID=2080747 RepID=UPI0015E40A93|nr:hypothetical protein [Streptomyces sp. Ru72]
MEAGNIVWYLKVIWHHDFPDEPVGILSEVGEDRYEVRKVEVFRGGRLDWADEFAVESEHNVGRGACASA